MHLFPISSYLQNIWRDFRTSLWDMLQNCMGSNSQTLQHCIAPWTLENRPMHGLRYPYWNPIANQITQSFTDATSYFLQTLQHSAIRQNRQNLVKTNQKIPPSTSCFISNWHNTIEPWTQRMELGRMNHTHFQCSLSTTACSRILGDTSFSSAQGLAIIHQL